MWEKKVESLIVYLQIEMTRLTVEAVKAQANMKKLDECSDDEKFKLLIEAAKNQGKLEALKVVTGIFADEN